VRASGYLPFDAAAIDVAFNAGPYPDPPRAIRSANGKIYVHWQFHRDERQCATSGVDYFILDNPPAGADRRSSRTRRPRRLPAAGRGAGRRGRPGQRPRATRRPRAAPGEHDRNDGGLRRLRRFDDKRHDAKMQRLDEEVARWPRAARRDQHRPARRAGRAPAPRRAAPTSARAIAERWFKALAADRRRAGDSALADVGQGRHKRAALVDATPAGRGSPAGGQSTPPPGCAPHRKLPANVDDGRAGSCTARSSGPREVILILASAQLAPGRPRPALRRARPPGRAAVETPGRGSVPALRAPPSRVAGQRAAPVCDVDDRPPAEHTRIAARCVERVARRRLDPRQRRPGKQAPPMRPSSGVQRLSADAEHAKSRCALRLEHPGRQVGVVTRP
jgi:hypothetical protein